MLEPVANEGIGAGQGPRPKLDIPHTKLEGCCELIALLVLIFMVTQLFGFRTNLPAQVPVHFNIVGQPDRWGSPNAIFLPYGIMFLLYAGISILQRFPHIYSYPFGLTPRNVHRQYQLARQLLVLIKAEIACSFAFIQFGMIGVARGRSQTLGLWFVPAMTGAILIAVVQYYIRAAKAR